MDDFPRETPRFWIAVSIFIVAIALSVIMLVYTSTKVHAQQICFPLPQMVQELGSKFQERIAWEGTIPTPQGPLEAFLFQSEKGSWSIVQSRNGLACVVLAGKDGTPIGDTGEEA